MLFDKFEKNIINLFGDVGRAWLASLPVLCDNVASKLGLTQLCPLDNLSYNYVLSGLQGTKPIILKLALDIEGLKHEAKVLDAFLGFGAVKVIAQEEGLLLLERLMPGVSLKSYFPAQENEAIDITANIIKHLHAAPISNKSQFSHVKDWLQVLDKDWPISSIHLQKAIILRDNLLKTSTQEVLLHGDLHHDNILRSGENQWQVIDPKGVIGDPVYELAAFIRNPIPALLEHKDVHKIIKNRIEHFSKALNFSKTRIQDWCFVQSVLSWIWTLEDNSEDQYFRYLTEFFDEYTND